MKAFSILVMTSLLLIVLVSTGYSQGAVKQATKVFEPGTGVYFEVEISSKGKPAIIWKNWRDGSRFYGESEIKGNRTIIIIKDGFSYSLSPDIKVANKSKLELDEQKNPMASKYGPLADIPQIDPVNYVSLLNRLNASNQGPTILPEGNIKSDLYNLKLPNDVKFPWNNFLVWINNDTLLPAKITYMDSAEQRTILFREIKKNVKVDPKLFEVPAGYKTIEYEWD